VRVVRSVEREPLWKLARKVALASRARLIMVWSGSRRMSIAVTAEFGIRRSIRVAVEYSGRPSQVLESRSQRTEIEPANRGPGRSLRIPASFAESVRRPLEERGLSRPSSGTTDKNSSSIA
jgi:hypothetical protein